MRDKYVETHNYASLRGKHVTVVGLARSGAGAARLLARHGAIVTVNDKRPADTLANAIAMLSATTPDNRVIILPGGHPDEAFDGAELVVISPGVPSNIEPLEKCRRRGVPVIGELELGFRFMNAPFAAITGTNGKSTVTTLLGLMIGASGKHAFVGGNIGLSICEAAADVEAGAMPRPDWVVAEVSSFQLETIQEFRPKIAAILNITPDHLDRYDSPDDYARAKTRIFERQAGGDVLVLNADDAAVAALGKIAPASVALFSRAIEVSNGVFMRGEMMCYNLDGSSGNIIPVADIKIRGVHNLENAMAASCMALLAGVKAEVIASVLREFPGLEHRLEHVAEIDGVTYINDSKGTNVGAVEKSLASFEQPVVLIAGGRDKASDFTALAPLVRRHAKAVVLIGEAAGKLEKALAGTVPIIHAESMADAVRKSRDAAKPGDVVLLSPACASFDMFRDFEDRGRVFKKEVGKLRE
ncbi:MAG: UDP-N-acetylmuramoyl-L-alanine--D-glutamate ligase [Nitrospirae bacterium]|nr:UDP-N-acetylmuramoyl-L-alanine--D-glutamate ligase [Nitrospirota bacterium]